MTNDESSTNHESPMTNGIRTEAAESALPRPSLDHSDLIRHSSFVIRHSAPARFVIPIVAGIGNALLAVPMVRQLKRALPQSHITILARLKAMAEVFHRQAVADDVRLLGRGNLGMLRSMLQVRHNRPDVFLIPFPSNRWQYMMLALASGAGRRILHRYPVGQIRALGFVPAERTPARRGIHDVVQNLDLLRLLGIEPDLSEAPRFPVNDADRAAADTLLAGVGLPPGVRPIAIHCGSARTVLAEAKRWPPAQYSRLIEALRQRFGDRVVILEGPDEAGVGDEIASHLSERPRVLRLLGSLGDAAGVLKRAEMYIGSDSGLAHLAAAVGTPPVTLFAPADPDRVCPFGYRHLVVQPPGRTCSPCFLYPFRSSHPKMRCRRPMCINDIPVDAVLAKVESAVAQSPIENRKSKIENQKSPLTH